MRRRRCGYKPLLALAAVWAGLFVLTWNDWLAMFGQWWHISTYNHVLFVPPIIGWLIYDRRVLLPALEPKAWWPGLIAVAVTMFVWLLGTIGGVNTIAQLGAVTALLASVLAILGSRIFFANGFAAAYALFLIPFGDELIPMLQMVTADMVIALTHWSGIPADIDGVFIDTPAGLFEVAEACSGVKFLIAMVALGSLVAYSCFSSWKRRILFMIAAIALPIAANGIRAWATIYIAQSAGIGFAEGFDHIFYGWVFFAIVVVALLAVAWPWFDRDADDIGVDLDVERSAGWLRSVLLCHRSEAFAGVAATILALAAVFALWHQTAIAITASVTRKGRASRRARLDAVRNIPPPGHGCRALMVRIIA